MYIVHQCVYFFAWGGYWGVSWTKSVHMYTVLAQQRMNACVKWNANQPLLHANSHFLWYPRHPHFHHTCFFQERKKRNSHHSSQVPSYLACCTPLSYTIPPFLLVLAEAVALPHNICSFFNRPREFRQTACSVTWQRLSQTANRSPQLRPHQPHRVVACPDLPWYVLCVW